MDRARTIPAMIIKLRPPRLIEIVLVLSLVLNLCVIGGYGYAHYFEGDRIPQISVDQRLTILASRIGIVPEESPAFQEWRKSFRAAQTSLAQQNRALVEEAWAEMIKPQPDILHIQALLDQISLHRHAFQTDTTASLIRFIGTLTPQQRQSLVRVVLDPQDPAGGPVRGAIGR